MDKTKVFVILVTAVLVLGSASAFHKDGMGGHGGGSSGGGITGGGTTSYYGYSSSFLHLDDPMTALTHFVAPFLLIAIIFQRGYEKALTFTFADDDSYSTYPYSESSEREKVKRYSLLMSLATAGIIVPTPWFQFIQVWVANLFSLIGVIFFGAIFAAFIWVLYKAFS